MGKAHTIGIGMDYSPHSKSALRWAADNLVDAGDRIILIHVQPPTADHTRKQLFVDTGSRKFINILMNLHALLSGSSINELMNLQLLFLWRNSGRLIFQGNMGLLVMLKFSKFLICCQGSKG